MEHGDLNPAVKQATRVCTLLAVKMPGRTCEMKYRLLEVLKPTRSNSEAAALQGGCLQLALIDSLDGHYWMTSMQLAPVCCKI